MKLKKTLSVILASLMIVCSVVIITPASSADTRLPFSDVVEGAWYYEAVEYAYTEGFMEGGGDGKFNPTGNLTRAMFVKMLGYIDGAEKTESDIFPDVKKGSWYSGYVGWAYENGIVMGLGNGTFGGDLNITRQELAVMVSRYIDYKGVNMPRRGTAPGKFADSGSISGWAKRAVEVLRRAGITKGNSSEEFMPKAEISRAEAAQILKNLAKAESLAWQGYIPAPDTDGYAVYGAKYLYNGGFAVQGGLGTDIDEDSEPYPSLYVYSDERSAELSYEPEDSFGFSPTSVVADLTKTPVVKICYSYEGADEPSVLTSYISTRYSMETTYRTSELTFTKGEDDEGWSTAVCDVSSYLSSVGAEFGTNSGCNVHIMFKPYEGITTADARFSVRYIALFEDEESAEAFESSELADYLNGYYVYTDIEYTEVGDDVVDGYHAEIRDRISEIKNSKSTVTPEDIEAAGGTCYYVSSINGDNSNDGLTPETALASADALFDYIEAADWYIPKTKSGDGVFFERGSEFYPQRYYNHTISTLSTTDGVTYGAYGNSSKPKPAFYGSFDFGGGTGNWSSTEWDDVYVIDLNDYVPEGKENFAREDGDIGGIIFNEGEYKAVRVYPTDENDPFGEGKTTKAMLEQGNGKDYYISGGTSCRNPDDALRNNLEYIHDWSTGKVYLRCEWGNPEKYFDRIDLCRNANICYASDNARFDNLAFLYSGYIALDLSDGNVVTWCEAGYAGGDTTSVGTGIGGYGECSSLIIDNCYIHDIEDGPMGTQLTSDYTDRPEDIPELNGVTCTNNVIIAAQNMVELFSTSRIAGEDGLGRNKIRNAVVTGNYAAYLGYGYPNIVDNDAEGLALHNWYYGEMVDCVFADNTMVSCEGSVIGAHVASDGNPRGWYMYDNTYVLNPKLCASLRGVDGVSFTNLSKSFYAAYKMPYSERYLTYLASIGIDSNSKFYAFDSMTDGEKFGAYVTTGWRFEHGYDPS